MPASNPKNLPRSARTLVTRSLPRRLAWRQPQQAFPLTISLASRQQQALSAGQCRAHLRTVIWTSRLGFWKEQQAVLLTVCDRGPQTCDDASLPRLYGGRAPPHTHPYALPDLSDWPVGWPKTLRFFFARCRRASREVAKLLTRATQPGLPSGEPLISVRGKSAPKTFPSP